MVEDEGGVGRLYGWDFSPLTLSLARLKQSLKALFLGIFYNFISFALPFS